MVRRLAWLALLAPWGCDSAPADPAVGARTVVMITIDSLNARFLEGVDRGWDTAPRIDALMAEGARLDHVVTVRGVTAPALSSITTGEYPREHGIRGNQAGASDLPSLFDRFDDAGYLTLGWSANQCELFVRSVDDRMCTWVGELPGDLPMIERDAMLVDGFVERLGALDPWEPVFAWIHLNNVHKPYERVSPWYEQWHPETWDGVDVADEPALDEITLGDEPITMDLLYELDAVIASEVRHADDEVGRVLDALAAVGRYDDAIIAFGADHGEELGVHSKHFYHGCSPYRPVGRVVWALRAPGLLPAGLVLHTPVSSVDLSPTLADLAGAFEWDPAAAGRSRLDEIAAGTLAEEPAFLERGGETAGLVLGDWRYLRSGEVGYDACEPFASDPEAVYASDFEELYDEGADPLDLADLARSETATRDALADLLCAWVLESPWVGEEVLDQNGLHGGCAEHVGSGGDTAAR